MSGSWTEIVEQCRHNRVLFARHLLGEDEYILTHAQSPSLSAALESWRLRAIPGELHQGDFLLPNRRKSVFSLIWGICGTLPQAQDVFSGSMYQKLTLQYPLLIEIG
jgi:hypothetical protein